MDVGEIALRDIGPLLTRSRSPRVPLQVDVSIADDVIREFRIGELIFVGLMLMLGCGDPLVRFDGPMTLGADTDGLVERSLVGDFRGDFKRIFTGIELGEGGVDDVGRVYLKMVYKKRDE